MKIQVGFDPTESWSNDFFREFIKTLISDVDNYEVFLVTTNTDLEFIQNVIAESNLTNTNSYQLLNNELLTEKLTLLNIVIYLSDDNVLVDFINKTIPIELSIGSVSGCQALLLNNILDSYRIQQKYITMFYFWVDRILRRLDNGKVC